MNEEALTSLRERIIGTDKLIRQNLEATREIDKLQQSLQLAQHRILMLEAENTRLAKEKGMLEDSYNEQINQLIKDVNYEKAKHIETK